MHKIVSISYIKENCIDINFVKSLGNIFKL